MVFESFAALGAYLYGLEPKPKPRKERTFFCRVCGKPMRHVGNSNVYLCEEVKDGKAYADYKTKWGTDDKR